MNYLNEQTEKQLTMDSIVNLLKNYDYEQNKQIEMLKQEIFNIKESHNNNNNVINTLIQEKKELNEQNNSMKNVSIVIRLTNEKIKLKEENDLLLKKISYLKNEVNSLKINKAPLENKSSKNIEIIKEYNTPPINSNRFTIKNNDRVNEVIKIFTKSNETEVITKEPIEKIIEIPLTKNIIEVSNEPIIEPIKESFNETLEESIEESVNEPIIEPIIETLEESIEESVNESIVEPIIEPIEEQIEEQIEEPINESIEELSEEQNEELIEEPIKKQNEELIEENNEEPNEEPIKEINYIIKKIKGIKYYIDEDNNIYTIGDNKELGEKIGIYKKKNKSN
jgi:hypothetical protein